MASIKRKGELKVALVGMGFGAEFVPIYRDHPDVGHVAIVETDRNRLDETGDRFSIDTRYSDLDDVLGGDYDAVHLITPIPQHASQTLSVLNAGKHCACTVPMALRLEDLKAIVEAQRNSGRNYMMMETAVYTREFLYAQTQMNAGRFGKISFARGSHYQDMEGWPQYWEGLPPHWYMTHAVAPALRLLSTRAERVHCFGSGTLPPDMASRYGNPFPAATAIFRLEGSDVALEVTRTLFESVRPYTEAFSIYGNLLGFEWAQIDEEAPYEFYLEDAHQRRGKRIESRRINVPDRDDLLPPEIAPFTTQSVHSRGEHLSFVQGGGHGGSHPHLVHEFVRSIVEGREPSIGAVTAANWTAAGICAHQSAMAGGEGVIIPKF